MSNYNFEWNDNLKTSNDTIDIQHQELISKISYFMEEVEKGNCRAMSEAIAFLTDYVFDHFALEERLMLKTNYDEFEKHRDEHSAYVKYIYKLRQMIEITPDQLDEISKELAYWFMDHIIVVDMRMAQHLKKFMDFV